ncbi:hypothetical protein WR25_16346 [Diploscapter pachys]|uniref:Uncharacterized protein n=1 Tax=Diploscapter pachys TaxID=2018661 RepID=A0A2A2LAV8_9BILA|nr:hypothetical protein WR25_16346 [Diploscapter pachys]
MMDGYSVMTSPSYHHISPLARSRSDVRSSAMRRANSFSGRTERSPSMNRLARAEYGYGGGFMYRSLSKCGKQLHLQWPVEVPYNAEWNFAEALCLVFAVSVGVAGLYLFLFYASYD